MLIVLGEAEVAPALRGRMAELASVMARATTSDDGCEHYGFFTDVTRPDVFASVEVWRDRAALDAHLSHAHTQEFLAAVPHLVLGVPTMRFFEGRPTQEEAR